MRKLLLLALLLGWPSVVIAGGQPQASIWTAAASFTLCTGPCAVVEINAGSASAEFLFVFDANTLPSNGTVGASAKAYAPIAAGQIVSMSYSAAEPGIFLNGVVLGCSSTAPPTFTSTASCFFFGRAN